MGKLENIIISPDISIKQALKRMDEMGEKTLFVADSENKLLGSITDGDIRRWILKGASLGENVSKPMNQNPIFLKEGYTQDEARNIMVSLVIECIPVVNNNKLITSAIWWMDLFDNRSKKTQITNIPVVIMAGGEGVRLSPFTNILPKPLMPIGEKPIIELIINKFTDFGCKDFYLSINYKASILKAYFSECEHSYNINYIQEDKPLGTIGSLHLLKNTIKSAFFVSNCDILIDADYSEILKFHKDNRNIITLVGSMKHYTIPYGICEIKDGGTLEAVKEKPEYDFLVNTGFYLMEKEVLKDIPDTSIYHFTDLVNDCLKKGNKIGVYPVSEKSWLDMGQWEELQNMLNKFKAE